MKRLIYIIGGILLFMVSCTSKKSTNEAMAGDMDSIAVMDSMRPDMPPPPPHGKGRPPHKPDNMRGFDPASGDDMDDNGMSRYMEKRVNSESRAMLA